MIRRGFFVFLGVLIIAMSFSGFAQEHSPKRVLATVGNQKITEQELDAFLQRVPEPFRKAFRKKALYGIIETKVFSALAKKQGLDKSPEFLARLEKEKDRLLAGYYIEKQLKPRATVSTSEARSYYERHKAEFRSNERVKVEEMRFSSKKEAEAAKGKLGSGDVSPGSMNGKEVWLEKGRIPRQIESAIFSLKPGQISDVIEFNKKYFLFKVIGRKDPGVRSFEEVKPLIIKRMEARKLAILKQQLLRKSGVKILDKSLEQNPTSGNGAFPSVK